MPGDIYQSLWREFALESGEHIERIEPLLVAVEASPGAADSGALAALFRSVHSLKGMAAALGLRGMEQVAHHVEHLLGVVRDGHCLLDRALAGVLLEALDELKRLRELSVHEQADISVNEAVVHRLLDVRAAIEMPVGTPAVGSADSPFADDSGFALAVEAALGAVASPGLSVSAIAASAGHVTAAGHVTTECPPPLCSDDRMLFDFVAAVRVVIPALASMVGRELESHATRIEVRRALETVRAGAERLEFTQVARTAELLAALIPIEGCLDYYAREQAIAALADLRREIATLEAATGCDGGGNALDAALKTALALDFNARRRALFDVLGNFATGEAGLTPGSAVVGRAAELAGDIYNHFSFLYNANAGRLLLIIEDVLGHAARGDMVLTTELLELIRQTLRSLAPTSGQPLHDIEPAEAAETIAAFERAIAAATSGDSADDDARLTGRRALEALGVPDDVIKRLSVAQLGETAAALADGRFRLWEIGAALEGAEDRADRFASWLEGNARTLTSWAASGTTALSFQFLLLTALDDTAVLSALAGIDPEAQMLSARRHGGLVVAPTRAAAVPPFVPASSSLTVVTPAVSPSASESRSIGSSSAGTVLRVPGEVVDHFLSVIGEMVMTSGMLDDAVWGDDRRSRLPLDLRRLLKELRAQGGIDPGHLEALQRYIAGQEARDRDLRKARDRLAVTLGRLQEAALELRVVPVETVFGRLPRLARDLAASHGKEVRVEVDGRGVRIDKGMVDQLLDPLIHMVRNAIDHGIELPAERLAAGKPSTATLLIRADQRENRVVIEVTDDGRGLDGEAIRVRAVERQLVGEATSRLLREADLHRLILQPGFSTADRVTETSGRGVGMDVVHTSVIRLGGAIDIRSKAGRGTTFTLRLPLSAAIQDVLLVEADSRLHAIPVRHLLELCSVRADDIQIVHGQSVILLHGALLPVFRLTGLLDDRFSGLPCADLPIVVLGDGRRRLGLQVDRVVRRQELFVRDIHPRIAAIPGIGGAALLGDGKVVLIVDGADLFHLAHVRQNGPPVPS